MADYDVQQLIEANRERYDRVRERIMAMPKPALSEAEKKALREVDKEVLDFAKNPVAHRAKKLEVIARDMGMPAEELAAMDIEMSTAQTARELEIPSQPGCCSSAMVLRYLDGHATPEESERVYSHCNTCAECSREVFEMYVWCYVRNP